MIWKPEIEFTNTKYKDKTVTDKDVVGTVIRYGNKIDTKEFMIYKTDKFYGEDNQVQFTR